MLVATSADRAFADDSAASVASGGIQLKKESRISMNSERLAITMNSVLVDYEFVNETDKDITTEVAFPIADYRCDQPIEGCPEKEFSDFRVWVEGREVTYSIDLKAVVKGHDYRNLLESLGIDVDAFGHFDDAALAQGAHDGGAKSDFAKLSPAERENLIQLGLIDRDETIPLWTIKKFFHWQQTFPARSTLHIRHEYKPLLGWTDLDYKSIQAADPENRRTRLEAARQQLKNISGDAKQSAEYKVWLLSTMDDICVDQNLNHRLEDGVRQKQAFILSWVDFILKTANNWRVPLKNFELLVEKPAPADRSQWYVSFCWNGPVERPDSTHFRASVRDFVPARDLRIAFFEARSEAPQTTR